MRAGRAVVVPAASALCGACAGELGLTPPRVLNSSRYSWHLREQSRNRPPHTLWGQAHDSLDRKAARVARRAETVFEKGPPPAPLHRRPSSARLVLVPFP